MSWNPQPGPHTQGPLTRASGDPYALDRGRFIAARRTTPDRWAYRGSSKPLLGRAVRHTLSYMKTSALTIRLDPELEKQLDRLAERTGRSRSEIVREALRRQLAVSQFQELRRRMMPFAEAAGYLTDEDVFRDVS